MDARLLAPQQPTPDYVWCDDCLRWEHMSNAKEHRNRVTPSMTARKLHAVSAFFADIAEMFLDLGDVAQIIDNTEKGLIIESPPKETLQ